MRNGRTIWTLGVLAVFAMSGAPAAAQQADVGDDHVVEAAETWETVAEEADRADEQRAMVRRVLDRPEVERAAEDHGFDLTRAQDAVSTLDGDELRVVAERAERLDAALTGGDPIVISATTLIIALLVLVIILVA